MKLILITFVAVVAGVMVGRSCDPTPNIEATVESKVGEALAKVPTVTPIPAPTSVPTATPVPTPTPIPMATPPPTLTP